MRILWFLLIPLACSKFVSMSISLTETENWRYFTKFAVDVGTGSYTIKAKFLKPQEPEGAFSTIIMPIYLDTSWDDALNQETCQAKLRAAKTEKELSLPNNGDWSVVVYGTVTQRMRPYFWYFALADCSYIPKNVRIKLEMTLLNADGSQFSLEEQDLVYMYLVALVVFIATLSNNVLRLFRRFNKSDSLEGPLFMMNCAVCSQMSSIFFKLVHLWVYSYDGKGVVILDFFSQASDIVSQLTINVMFILISMGWTIKFKDFPDVDIYVPVAFLIVVLHLLTAGLGRISDDSYYKFSDFEGVAGVLLMLLRLCLFGWFAFSIKQLYAGSQGAMASMVWNLSLIASAYFLAIPGLGIASRFLAAYLRNKFVVFGSLGVQMVAFIVLTRLFDQRSSYYKASTLSESVLPGSKLR